MQNEMKTQGSSDASYVEVKPSMSVCNPYTRSFRALKLGCIQIPKDFSQWFWFIYGLDIFYGPVPFCKGILLANMLVWMILK